MYEEMWAPVPDVGAYLARMGLSPADVSVQNRKTLDSLVYAHQTHIPFEDLDSALAKLPISLEIPVIFDKIVTRKRGGYCYEMNGLFTRLLCDLGFDASSVFCRIVSGRDFIPPCFHRGILVRLQEELLYCDVGFGGPQPPGSVLVREGAETISHGEVFQTRRYDDGWWILSRTDSRGIRQDILHFSEFAQTPQEFIAANYYAYACPASIFSHQVMVNLRNETGHKNITGDLYTSVLEGQRCERRLENREELRRTLSEEFAIDFAPCKI
ncbi:MAG: arylamine N-acetyltransferase [Blautia sp.]|nr:arylamine N-acetyltransferase [Blautia sp.]